MFSLTFKTFKIKIKILIKIWTDPTSTKSSTNINILITNQMNNKILVWII
jgi:hypothetical protein